MTNGGNTNIMSYISNEQLIEWPRESPESAISIKHRQKSHSDPKSDDSDLFLSICRSKQFFESKKYIYLFTVFGLCSPLIFLLLLCCRLWTPWPEWHWGICHIIRWQWTLYSSPLPIKRLSRFSWKHLGSSQFQIPLPHY